MIIYIYRDGERLGMREAPTCFRFFTPFSQPCLTSHTQTAGTALAQQGPLSWGPADPLQTLKSCQCLGEAGEMGAGVRNSSNCLPNKDCELRTRFPESEFL